MSTVIGPVHWATTVYQTSGELVELPHGAGLRLPPAEGVAQMVVPQSGGAFKVSVTAFGQRSLVGGLLVTVIVFRHNELLPQQSVARQIRR